MYKFGLSVLHSWLRFFDCIIHISYRLDVKKWRITEDCEKALVEKRKKLIHDEFKSKTGLRIDEPRKGSGNSNDGNTARRFFSDPELASKITGVHVRLIERFSTILFCVQFFADIKLKVKSLNSTPKKRRNYTWTSTIGTICQAVCT